MILKLKNDNQIGIEDYELRQNIYETAQSLNENVQIRC
jgi:hypothetical protein